MKNPLTLLFLFIIPVLCITSITAQSPWAIVGYNGSTGDGISIVATEDIPPSTTIYITDREYSDIANAFNIQEGVISYTTPGSVTPKGEVITFTETGTSTNVFSVACSSGTCGTHNLESGLISFASTTAEYVYLYTDSDNLPENGVLEIYSVIVSQGTFALADENPQFDYPNSIVVDGFSPSGDHRDFMTALRTGTVTKSQLEDPANYDAPTTNGNQVLDLTPFVDITLPVKLVDFTARALGDQRVNLNWATEIEINNDRFEIERSSDGKSFEKIGERPGKGNSISKIKYSFTDINPSQRMNYYRLKQVDFDGAYAYSDIVHLHMNSNSLPVTVGPNPFTDYIEIYYTQNFEQPVQVQITDLSGRLVYNSSFDGELSTLFVPLSDLKSGHFILRINDGQRKTIERLVKI